MIDPTKKVFSLFDEFKNFAFKGNVIDLAVAVIIGGAFNTIVQSLVKNIIMPLIALVTPANGDYKTMQWNHITYGEFLGDVVNFIIVAFVIFIVIVKFLGWVMRSKKETPPPAPTKQEELLTEIRDLLKSQRT